MTNTFLTIWQFWQFPRVMYVSPGYNYRVWCSSRRGSQWKGQLIFHCTRVVTLLQKPYGDYEKHYSTTLGFIMWRNRLSSRLHCIMNYLCQVSRADLMAPNSSFSPLRDGGPDLSCEEEDDISYRLEPLPSSQPVLPPPPCRPFSATSLSHKRSVGQGRVGNISLCNQ